jgi:hypothetical protein
MSSITPGTGVQIKRLFLITGERVFIFWYSIIMGFGLSFKVSPLDKDLHDRVNITLAVKFGIFTHLTNYDFGCDRFYIGLP